MPAFTSLRAAKLPGRYSLGFNLYLDVAKGGSQSWIFMFKAEGKQREKSIGPARLFSKDDAQATAVEWYINLKRHGIMPGTLLASPAPSMLASTTASVAAPVVAGQTFAWWLERLLPLKAKADQWKGFEKLTGVVADDNKACGTMRKWRANMANHAKAILDTPVNMVGFDAVDAIVGPIWQDIPKTANDVRQQIELVIEHAAANDGYVGENPARKKRIEGKFLTGYRKSDAKPHASMPYDELPAFMAKLAPHTGMRAQALKIAVLCANRSAEALEMERAEVDLESGLWTIPGERTKTGKVHQMLLSTQALAILRGIEATPGNPYFFAGQVKGRPISNSSLRKKLQEMGIEPDYATPHGFRSSWRDWGGEETEIDREVLEFQMGHGVKDATEGAYRRGKALKKRGKALQDWADYLYTVVEGRSATVTALRA